MLRHYASRRVALVEVKKAFKISGATFFVALLRIVLRLLLKIFVALTIYANKLHIFYFCIFMQICSFLQIGKIKQFHPLQVVRHCIADP